MKMTVLGTGMVGRANAQRLLSLGHDVVMGTRSPDKTLAATDKDFMGNPPFAEWHKKNNTIKLLRFSEATSHGEIIFNALAGHSAVDVLKDLADEINEKVVIDISNPLDFSKGMPPTLFVSNTDSLGEEIQRALPKAKVVKTLNTTNAYIQVDPKSLANGDHHMFLSGNDDQAKRKTTEILRGYGWSNIVDLGDITNARGMEMFVTLWVRLFGTFKDPMFNIKIVKN